MFNIASYLLQASGYCYILCYIYWSCTSKISPRLILNLLFFSDNYTKASFFIFALFSNGLQKYSWWVVLLMLEFISVVVCVAVLGVVLVNISIFFVWFIWLLLLFVLICVPIPNIACVLSELAVPCCYLSNLKLNNDDSKSLKLCVLVFLLFFIPSELSLFVFL